MNSKDLRSLLQKLNHYIVRNLDTATGLGIKREHYEIGMEHLLIALLQDGQGDVPAILRNYDVDAADVQRACLRNIEEMKSGNPGKPRLSPLLTDMLEKAWIASSVQQREAKIRSGALFSVFIASEQVISSGMMDLFSPINQEDLQSNFYEIVAGSCEGASSAADDLPQETASAIPQGGSVLDLYAMNLTQQAKDGKIDPILGRDDEIIQMIEILSRRKKSNPIVLGEPGVGKTALVEGLALKVAADEVPDILKNVQIHALDLGALQAGTKMRGEFEKRLKAVINEVTASPKAIILFIDEVHTLIGAGASQGGGDAANLLKPALARGEFRAIAATTYLEYNKYFAKDAALERRFQPIHVGEPEDDKAMLMLRGIKKSYEKYHGIHVTDEAVEASVRLSRKYIAGRQLPDKAVDLLDTSATRVKMSMTSKPPSLELRGSRLRAVDLEIQSLEKDKSLHVDEHQEALEKLQAEKSALETEIAEKEERWQKECDSIKNLMNLRKQKLSDAESNGVDSEIQKVKTELRELQGENPQVFADVTSTTVAEVIESWTGVPVGRMTQDEMESVLQIEKSLQQRVVGQDHAIKQIADVIRGSKVGMNKEDAPIGVFLLVGPSGVGKTELARAVAEALFGDERFMITLNMTEYQNEYNTSRLIGADPGLVGYGEGGALSEPVRRRPYSVVLLDEIEKANSSVIDLFMQVFDRGMLQDSDRRQIDFTNTIIFMTSNFASEIIFESYNKGESDPDKLLEVLRPYLTQGFRPEFLGRLKPIVFLPLAEDVMKMITELKLGKLTARLKRNQNIDVEYSKSVVEQITASCTAAETGARNIDAIIDRTLTPEISAQLLGYMAEGKSPTKLKVTKTKAGDFSYKFS